MPLSHARLWSALDALARRITMRERARVRVDDQSFAAGLHLPTLGSPADLERFGLKDLRA